MAMFSTSAAPLLVSFLASALIYTPAALSLMHRRGDDNTANKAPMCAFGFQGIPDELFYCKGPYYEGKNFIFYNDPTHNQWKIIPHGKKDQVLGDGPYVGNAWTSCNVRALDVGETCGGFKEWINGDGEVSSKGLVVEGPCPTPSPTSSPTDVSVHVMNITSPTSSPTDVSVGFGDPHMMNIIGEHFNIWLLGEVELLRIPRNSSYRPQLRFVATVSNTDDSQSGSDCNTAPYMTSMRLGGAWFDDRELSVKMVDGEMRVILGSMSITPSSEQVTVKSKLIVARPSEARVTVQVGNATIDVKHDDFFNPHFYLNMEARNLASLGFEIGGVLGIDDHSVFVQRPKRCEKNILAAVADRHSTHMIASLD